MSTRATYRITEAPRQYEVIPPRTYYIHYDGYPQGAAAYFKQLLDYMRDYKDRITTLFHGDPYMIKRNINNKRFSSFFEMGVPMSEETFDHDSHGDTEYQYNIFLKEDGEIYVSMKSLYGHEPQFFDTMDKFLEKYGGK